MAYNGARNRFFDSVGRTMKENDIYVVSADLAGPPFDFIRGNYPERFVSVGIAEQNMISVAVGIALTGKRVIAYAPEPFVITRAYDQIRNGICSMHAPVTIAGLGTGLNNAEYGATHFVTEDLALGLLCPGLRQITVNDEDIADAAFEYMLGCKEPLYLRFDRVCSGTHSDEAVSVETGFRTLIGAESDTVIIAEGYPVLRIFDALKERNISAGLIEVFAHPFDEKALLSEISDKKHIIVCEEQQTVCGLGSTIRRLADENNVPARLTIMGIDYHNSFPGTFGSREYWMDKLEVDENAVIRVLEKLSRDN